METSCYTQNDSTGAKRKPAFILVIVATIPVITLILWEDQPIESEGSIKLMIMGMDCSVSPGPTKMTMVASTKMIVVLPNRKMCPMESDKDPLELRREAKETRKEGERAEGHSQLYPD